VESAAVQASPALTVTAYVNPANLDTAPDAIETALLDYFGSLPIGGTKLVGTTGYVLLSRMMEACQTQEGVKAITLSVTANIALAANEIYVPAITVNAIAVSPGAL
jgi:hypothetical protein